MLNKIRLALFVVLCSFYSQAFGHGEMNIDSLNNIFNRADHTERDRKVITYLKAVFELDAVDHFNADKATLDNFLLTNHVSEKPELELFVSSLIASRKQKLAEAENDLIKAIDLSSKKQEHYLTYAFNSHLAFIQTYLGNTIEAVSSFRMANKEAIILGDPFLTVLIDVNISDIYYRNNFYIQSLTYLNEAEVMVAMHGLNEPRLKSTLLYNKAEVFFRMNNIDSVKKYGRILNNLKNGSNKLYRYQKRVGYFQLILHRNYQAAIHSIIALQKDSLYKFGNIDEQNLADAYYHAGMGDSAKNVINRLLNEPGQKNHPEINLNLYRVLGEIAQNENDDQAAAANFKIALQEAEEQISRLTQVGDISSQMKTDEVERSYIQKEKKYNTERLLLIFIVVMALLAIAVLIMFYRSVKQKRYYEKLLFASRNEELVFINSHEVRRHLSNILGIIDLIKHSDDKTEEYLQAHDRLLYSAECLDDAIKSISEKLDN